MPANCETNGIRYTKTILENICNPCNEDDGLRTCSYVCADVNFASRNGTYYPNTSYDALAACPKFWQNESNKIQIEPASLPLTLLGQTARLAYCSGITILQVFSLKNRFNQGQFCRNLNESPLPF